MKEAESNILNLPFWSPRKYIFASLVKLHKKIILKHLSKDNYAKLLDYGSEDSPYKYLYAPKVTDYLRADIPDSKHNVDIDVNIIPGEPLPLGSDSIDLVLSTQVLEHVEDYMGYLKEARRVLKDDGLVILSTHGTYEHHPCPTDYWRWTSDGMKKIFKDSNLKIIEFYGVMNYASTAILILQDKLAQKLPRILRPSLYIFAHMCMKLFGGRGFKHNDACIFCVVASKNHSGKAK